jgi:hypothetical protein
MVIKLREKFTDVLENKKTTVRQDMLLCTAVTLSSAFYEFENSIPGIAADFVRITLLFLLLICWLWCAFLNGFRKKYPFLIFTFLFWFIPRLIIAARANMSILNYNKYLDAASQFSSLIAEMSLKNLSDSLNISYFSASVILIAWCFGLFCGGRILSNLNLKRSKNL